MAFDLKTAIASVAPTLATMLLGPLAGTATAALCEVFGLEPGATPEQVAQAAQTKMTPEVVAALRVADLKHAEVMGQQDIDLEKLNKDFDLASETVAAGDRDSARKREAVVGDGTTRNLAYLIVGAGIAMIAATLAGFTKAESVLAGTLIGYAVGEMKAVTQYYFGTSSSSRQKDDRIEKLSNDKKI